MRYLLLIAIGMTSSGCLLELLTTTAIQGELSAQSAQQGQQVMNQAKDTTRKTELEQAIRMYSFDKEHYPARLEDLVPAYLPEVPVRGNGNPFAYNPTTGKVSLRVEKTPYRRGTPAVMTQTDVENLGLMRTAIYDYWSATGVYPKSLDSLTPLYIDSLPSMSSGGAFLYDASTGAVNHPAELVQSPPTGGGDAPQRKPKMIQENYSDSQLEQLVELGF